jgi:hypothetical protein
VVFLTALAVSSQAIDFQEKYTMILPSGESISTVYNRSALITMVALHD